MREHDEMTASVAAACSALAPFFLHDPTDEAVASAYDALRGLSADEAASGWPFAVAEDTHCAFALMEEGLAPAVWDDLIWEYRRLFAEPGPKVTPAWGSVYTDRECVTFGASTLALRSWMRERGISGVRQGTEPEDHIGLMLMLAAWLAEQQPEALDEYLSQHLLTWAPHFLEEVQQTSAHPFFQGLALLTRSTLMGMQDALQLDVRTPRFFR